MNKIDPICGMKGTIEAYGHYFCCPNCVKKYEDLNHIKQENSCESCHTPHKKWFTENLFLVLFGLAGIGIIHIILSSFGISILENLIGSFIDYFKMIWLALLIGLLLGGVIDHLVPRQYITKYLTENRKSSIFYSVGFGFLMSACSHGILAISMELYKKGASTPSVIAFLLASPWANLPITIILFGFFGLKAILFVIFAIIIAIITGLIYQVLDNKGKIENKNRNEKIYKEFSIIGDVKKRMKEYKFTFENILHDIKGVFNGSWALSKMVLWWTLIGMLLASAAQAYIPQDFFMKYMGASFLGLIITLVLATVIEVCSEGTAPLSFEIFRQTAAFGNSFVFLMAGVATDYTEIGLIWTNIGKKAAIWLPIITVPQILILGYLFNVLL